MSTITPLYFDVRSYRIETFWSPVSNGYIAVVYDVPQVSGWGMTAGAATDDAQTNLKAWVHQQKLLGNGELIPYPSRSKFADMVQSQRRA